MIRIRGKRSSLGGYVRKIAANSTFEQVKLARKASSSKSVSQGRGSHWWNMTEMTGFRLILRGIEL